MNIADCTIVQSAFKYLIVPLASFMVLKKLFLAILNQGSHIALSCHSSVFSFNPNYFSFYLLQVKYYNKILVLKYIWNFKGIIMNS